MATVKVNGTMNGLVHKGGTWASPATMPDVCKTPTPGGPVPMPYPNVSDSGSLTGGSTTVKVDGGNMAAIKGSKFSTSIGDEPGTAGGVKSSTFKKASTWITYSFDVKIDGKNACRFTDKKFQNDENTVDAAGTVPLVVVVELDEVKMKCGELNQYGEQKKVSGKGKSDRDHVPSKAALKAKAAKLMKVDTPDLPDCVAKKIDAGALAIVIPKRAHQECSETYGQTMAEAEADADDLKGAAERDTKTLEKEIENYDPACKEAYKKAARKVRKITNRQYTNWIKKIIADC
ncbi:DUF4150 domain-containing protein [Variovorax sp. RKNM96]|uniref:DUF4150 domain-containing protein n=1 Tax=Variovorax sp. RKNM96 TaxID=2681552 RepID=UPI00197EAFD3|nr:DUF4150 domain-containing protein [Variovorax sp. RKNM96]